MTPSGMDAKMATQIIQDYKDDLTDNKQADRDLSEQAKGYLEGMKDPAVLALVEALEQCHDAVVGKWPNGSAAIDAENALANYREATQ